MNFKNILIFFSIIIVLSISLNGVSAISNDGNVTFDVSDDYDVDLAVYDNSFDGNYSLSSASVDGNYSLSSASVDDSCSNLSGLNESLVSVVNNTESNGTVDNTSSTMNNGMWLRSSDMDNLNFQLMANYGINHIFLNEAAFNKYSLSYIKSWIASANSYGIKVHIWIQTFYSNGVWVSPVSTNGSFNTELLNKKITDALKYAAVTGVEGIHLDYLRFLGNASKYKNASGSINYFVKELSTQLKAQYPNIILSAIVMPESLSSDKYYYGQDFVTLSGYLDVICPMAYKGNYKTDTDWINSVTKRFVSASTHAKVWVGLQAYKSDSDLEKLSTTELYADCRSSILGGAEGFVLFRYGLTNFFNFRTCYNLTKVKFSASSLVTTYNSGKYLKINVTENNKPVANLKLRLNVYTGTTYKSVIVTTNSKGIAYYYGSTLSIGKHKIYINAYDTSNVSVTPITSYITVNKGITTVTAPIVKNKYKKSAYFKATVINKASSKVISGLTIKIKVYTGKKYKIYTVKTNSKGIAYLNTKALAKGTHKVLITSGDSRYTVSKTTYIKIV